MTAQVNPLAVMDTIRTLATLVRLHEGNRDSEINALLDRAERHGDEVAELVAAAKGVAFVQLNRRTPANDLGKAKQLRLRAALAPFLVGEKA